MAVVDGSIITVYRVYNGNESVYSGCSDNANFIDQFLNQNPRQTSNQVTDHGSILQRNIIRLIDQN